MAESDWTQVRIRNELYDQIENATESLTERKVRKYKSVPIFVEKACICLLDKEGVN